MFGRESVKRRPRILVGVGVRSLDRREPREINYLDEMLQKLRVE